MAKFLLRKQATELRLKGYTYSQIKRELGLSKSTLSDWLRNFPLSVEQLTLLAENRAISEDIRIEKFRQTALNKRLRGLNKILARQKKLLPLSKKELFIAGLFLYWEEGSKKHGSVAISNTNPQVIVFALFWLTKIIHIARKKIKVRLHLYNDMDTNQETAFWSKITQIPTKQFNPPYIKKSNRENLSYKSFGHGTCNLICFNVLLSEKIAMSLKAISDYYGAKSELFWYN